MNSRECSLARTACLGESWQHRVIMKRPIGYGVTLIERSTPGECLFQKGMASLQEARTIFVDCHAALDVDWVDHIFMSSQSEYVVQ